LESLQPSCILPDGTNDYEDRLLLGRYENWFNRRHGRSQRVTVLHAFDIRDLTKIQGEVLE